MENSFGTDSGIIMLSTLPWQRLLRRELFSLFLVIFVADIVVGYLLPAFPLRAREIGASLLLIGGLAAFNGATQVTASVPIGMVSDRFGRRRLIAAGCLFFAVAAMLLALAPAPQWLLLAQVLLGLGIISVFAMGAAMVGDYAAPSERGLAMGMLTTAMGLGFATGPLLGGLLAEYFGAGQSLMVMAMIALVAAALAWSTLVDEGSIRGVRAANPLANLRVLASSRLILLAAVANLLISPLFAGVVVNFMPIQASNLGFSVIAIGGLYSMRGLVSTFTRLPIGALSTPQWSYRVMLVAMVLGGVAVMAMARLTGYVGLSVALVAEGISYGMFLTAGQAFVTQYAEPQVRGAALGAYNMAGGVSIALSPFLLGALAEQVGLNSVFLGTGALLLVGTLVLAFAFPRALASVRA
ncbi:MAG: MFS transporter [Caldilinea sp.]